MKRRRAVSLTATALGVALAGCLGGGDDDDDGEADGSEDQQPDDETEDQPADNSGTEDGTPDAPYGGAMEGVSQGGYLALGASSDSDARENGFSLPAEEEGEDPVVVAATIDENGQWESTDVDFKSIPIDEPVEGEIEVGFPDGLAGEIDIDGDLMTATGELVATVFASGDELGEINFELDATTEQSGALTGAAAFDEDPPSVTLVDNEFAVEGSGNPIVDGFVGLPTDAGENWFELTLDLTPA